MYSPLLLSPCTSCTTSAANLKMGSKETGTGRICSIIFSSKSCSESEDELEDEDEDILCFLQQELSKYCSESSADESEDEPEDE
jgi:hypothetical protein